MENQFGFALYSAGFHYLLLSALVITPRSPPPPVRWTI